MLAVQYYRIFLNEQCVNLNTEAYLFVKRVEIFGKIHKSLLLACCSRFTSQ